MVGTGEEVTDEVNEVGDDETDDDEKGDVD